MDFEKFKRGAEGTSVKRTYISFDSETDAETVGKIQALKGQYDLKAVVAATIDQLYDAVSKPSKK